jgi:hypothetical protein
MSIASLFKKPVAVAIDAPQLGVAHAKHAALHAQKQQQAREFDDLSTRIAAIHSEVVAHDLDVQTLAALENALLDHRVAVELGRPIPTSLEDTQRHIDEVRGRVERPRAGILTNLRAELERERLALRDRQIKIDQELNANLWHVLHEDLEVKAVAALADQARAAASRRDCFVISHAMDQVHSMLRVGTYCDSRSYLDASIPMPRISPFVDPDADVFKQGRDNAAALLRRDADAQALQKEAEQLLHSLLTGESSRHAA